MLTRLTTALLGIVLASASLQLAYETGARDGGGRTGAVAAELPADLSVIEQVYDRVSADAVETPGGAALVEGAVDGLLTSLGDQYAEYYTPGEYAALGEQLDGRFTGIGVVLEDTETGLTVQTVLPGSPAKEAGLVAGDQVVTVDGVDVTEEARELVVERVKGEEGTFVVLGLEGPGGTREVRVERRVLDLPNVEAELLGDGVGHVRLAQFTTESGEQVRTAVTDLVADGARGIVLDLRDNPGGLLPAAIEVASVFVGDATIVRVGADPESAQEYLAEEGEGPVAGGLPLAVLVNAGSASASEIVAGAVQDLGAGTIVGTTTFGKGTVQTISGLEGGAGVKFTTARYFTPSGDSIDGIGVVPDEVVEAVEGDEDVQLTAAQRTLAALLAAQPAPSG